MDVIRVFCMLTSAVTLFILPNQVLPTRKGK